MRTFSFVLGAFVAGVCLPAATAWAADCAYDPETTGLARIIAVDSTAGPVYGRVLNTKEVKPYSRSIALRDKEVVLTFDDGPLPTPTTTVLDALDRHCVKATFFSVGKMAASNGRTLKEIDKRGHTIGTHTWSHPRAMHELPVEDIKYEIEKGFAAVSTALGKPIAPFFRFPGLRDSEGGVAYLSSRNISTWSVDVISGDTEPDATSEKIAMNTLARIRRLGRGIILFHDIKKTTAEAMDTILYALRAEGFKVVHVVSNTSYQPDEALVANADQLKSGSQPVSFTGQYVKSEKPQLKDGHVDYMHTEWIDLQEMNKRSSLQDGQSSVAEVRGDMRVQALPASMAIGAAGQRVR